MSGDSSSLFYWVFILFDFVNRKKGIVQAIMALAVLPFLFWGVESYRSDGEESYVAIVDGEQIQRREFELALRDQQERMRSMLGDKFDSSLLDNAEVRASILDSLIQQRLLKSEAVNHGFTVLDSQIVKVIQEIPEFQIDGQFSNQRYQEFLSSQGITPVLFESRVRQETLLQQLLDGYSENGVVSTTVSENTMYLSEVQREIAQVNIKPEQFLAKITPDEAAIEAYYNRHKTEFNVPEQVRLQYLVLSLDDLVKEETVSPDEVQSYFDEHQEEFGQPEERQASHILISTSDGMSDEEKQAARKEAEELLTEVKKDPNNFADLAKKHSDDPGSASQGGDLGFFGRGVMVKAFEDKIYQMQINEISDVVETSFGFHIIKLSAIKAAKIADFESVKSQIEENLKRQKASSVFGELTESFSNAVYEQSDSLQGAAEQLGLKIQESDWITRRSNEPVILTNKDLLAAVFSDDAIQDRRNTEAIEVQPDTFVSARVIDHNAVTSQSLAIVKDKIVERVKAQQAIEMVKEDGEKKLAQLRAGKPISDTWGENIQVSYLNPQGVSIDMIREIFKTDVKKLPAYTGIVDPQGGYTLVRISRVIEPDMSDTKKSVAFSKQLQQMITQEEMSAYLDGIKQRHDITIKDISF